MELQGKGVSLHLKYMEFIFVAYDIINPILNILQKCPLLISESSKHQLFWWRTKTMQLGFVGLDDKMNLEFSELSGRGGSQISSLDNGL